MPGAGPIGATNVDQQIRSLYENVLDHLKKIENSPYSQDVAKWETEIRTWINDILGKSQRVTLKRRPGALDKYLQRIIGVTGDDLENLLPSPVLIFNPCLFNRTLPFCVGAPSAGPATT